MVGRRNFLKALAVAPAAGLSFGYPANGQDKVSNRLGFIGPEDDPTFGPAITGVARSGDSALVGTTPARHDEIAYAVKLVLNVPYAKPHMQIASYFEQLKDKNKDGELYNREWADRSNPLIVSFFSLTNTLPSSGDQTSWCAAFVNFCLYASGNRGTLSALSGSFRSWEGRDEKDAKPGDIVVFKKKGTDGPKGFGHVAFLKSISADGGSFELLGGNQVGSTGSTGAVTTAIFPRETSTLELVGIRKIKT